MDKIDYLKNRKFSMENELTKLANSSKQNSSLIRMQKLKSQINEANFQINNFEKNRDSGKTISNNKDDHQRDIFKTINNRNQ